MMELKLVETREDRQHSFSSEIALRAVMDSGIFATLRSVPNGPAAQAVYMALIRRLPCVMPGMKRLSQNTGIKQRQVYRALGVLRQIGLVEGERELSGAGDWDLMEHTILDLRVQSNVKRCKAAIDRLVRSPKAGTDTGDSTSSTRSTVTDDSKPTVRGDAEVLSPVTPKDTIKKQTKNQTFAAGETKSLKPDSSALSRSLSKWGILSAAYLVDERHPNRIHELASNLDAAPSLIDATMGLREWGPDTGIGLKVTHLREYVAEGVTVLSRKAKHQADQQQKILSEARMVLEALPGPVGLEQLHSVGRERCKTLMARGIQRLATTDDVKQVLRKDALACRRILASELETQQYLQKIEAMDEEELGVLRMNILERYPPLTETLSDLPLDSPLLRAEFLKLLRCRDKEGQ